MSSRWISLTLAERGLLESVERAMLLYGPMEDDWQAVAQRTMALPVDHEFIRETWPKIRGLFVPSTDGGLMDPEIDASLADAMVRIAQAREAGKHGGRKKKGNGNRTVHQTQSEPSQSGNRADSNRASETTTDETTTNETTEESTSETTTTDGARALEASADDCERFTPVSLGILPASGRSSSSGLTPVGALVIRADALAKAQRLLMTTAKICTGRDWETPDNAMVQRILQAAGGENPLARLEALCNEIALAKPEIRSYPYFEGALKNKAVA